LGNGKKKRDLEKRGWGGKFLKKDGEPFRHEDLEMEGKQRREGGGGKLEGRFYKVATTGGKRTTLNNTKWGEV